MTIREMPKRKWEGFEFYIHEPNDKWIDTNIMDDVIGKRCYGSEFPGIVVDIGGNIGITTVLMAQTAKKVITYEPALENYELLVANIDLNQLQNVTAIKKAVTGKRETKDFEVSRINYASSSFNKDRIKEEPDSPNLYLEKDIPCITLEDVFTENNIHHIDTLKMDCEGDEFWILKNAEMATLKRINRIVMEVHPYYKDDWKSTDLFKMLDAAGFTFEKPHPTRYDDIYILHATR